MNTDPATVILLILLGLWLLSSALKPLQEAIRQRRAEDERYQRRLEVQELRREWGPVIHSHTAKCRACGAKAIALVYESGDIEYRCTECDYVWW
ncbi:MAG: hypothetical protein IRZ26_09455 [Clostridia bacterium]|nr:hypothetical protein [Clostridia bacterium]